MNITVPDTIGHPEIPQSCYCAQLKCRITDVTSRMLCDVISDFVTNFRWSNDNIGVCVVAFIGVNESIILILTQTPLEV